MRLFYSITSPYARKIRIAIAEKGMADRVTEESVNTIADPAVVRAVNPLAKIPVLILEDGTGIFDSPVILEYLDMIDDRVRLIPADPAGRMAALQLQALADGILDAAFQIVMEHRRPEAHRSAMWLDRWQQAIMLGTTALGREADSWGDRFGVGEITVAAALGYLDFRLPELDWRGVAPAAASWWQNAAERPNVKNTRPE